jgi:hypothetical protein
MPTAALRGAPRRKFGYPPTKPTHPVARANWARFAAAEPAVAARKPAAATARKPAAVRKPVAARKLAAARKPVAARKLAAARKPVAARKLAAARKPKPAAAEAPASAAAVPSDDATAFEGRLTWGDIREFREREVAQRWHRENPLGDGDLLDGIYAYLAEMLYLFNN